MTAGIAFRRVERSDFPLLTRWLAEPHVARWWNHEWSPEAIERGFGQSVDGLEPGEDWLALLDDTPLGMIQYCRFADYPEYLEELSAVMEVPEGAESIDYMIGDPALTGRGLGPAMIRAFVARIWDADPTATCVVVPVAAANRGSWRALELAGFARVARGPLEPDNPVDDPLHEVLQLDRPPRPAGQ